MSLDIKVKGAGWLPILSAVFLLSFWILFAVFLPMQERYVNWVLDSDWTWINSIGFTGSVLGIFALSVLFDKILNKRWLDYLAFGCAQTGIIMLTCLLFFEAFVLKGIALQNPELVDLDGSYYQHPVFKLATLAGGIFFAVGIVVLGIRMLIKNTFRKWKLIVLMIGCPLFGITAVPGNLRLVGVLLYSIAFIAMGIEMLKEKPVPRERPY